MDIQIQNITPDYKRIYADILEKKFPEKMDQCNVFLQKEKLSSLDILKLNQKIFGVAQKENEAFNRQHRSYKKTDITEILKFQRKNNMNNIQLANHFKISRNTVAKWKKITIEDLNFD